MKFLLILIIAFPVFSSALKLKSLVERNSLSYLQEVYNSDKDNKDKKSLLKQINKKNSGQTVLFIAVKKDNLKMTEFLIKAGADVNSTDKTGLAPICYAIKTKWRITKNRLDVTIKDIGKFLIKHNADINVSCKKGITPFHAAIWAGETDLVNKMLPTVKVSTYNALITHKDANLFPSHLAAWKKNNAALKQICKKAPKTINAKDYWGWTPLHYTVWLGDPKSAKTLLDCEADSNIKNEDGHIPVEVKMNKSASLSEVTKVKSIINNYKK